MRVKPKVYLETTMISYLAAWPSRDLVTAAHQQVTREWWMRRRHEFDLYVSRIVLEEAQRGDEEAAKARLRIIKDIPILALAPEVVSFAKEMMRQTFLPDKASVDALHISVAVLSGMDILLTWNCAHIANATFRSRVEHFCREKELEPPIICTPEELLEG